MAARVIAAWLDSGGEIDAFRFDAGRGSMLHLSAPARRDATRTGLKPEPWDSLRRAGNSLADTGDSQISTFVAVGTNPEHAETFRQIHGCVARLVDVIISNDGMRISTQQEAIPLTLDACPGMAEPLDALTDLINETRGRLSRRVLRGASGRWETVEAGPGVSWLCARAIDPAINALLDGGHCWLRRCRRASDSLCAHPIFFVTDARREYCSDRCRNRAVAQARRDDQRQEANAAIERHRKKW